MMIWVSDAARIRAVQKTVHAGLLARHNGIEDFQIRNTTAVLQAAEKARNSLSYNFV